MQIKLYSPSTSELLPRLLNHRRFKTEFKMRSPNCRVIRIGSPPHLPPLRSVSLYFHLAIYMYFIWVPFDVCYDENVNVLMIKLIFPPLLSRNSIAASAVCAFNLSAITQAFNGPFRYQENPRSAWLPTINPTPNFQVFLQHLNLLQTLLRFSLMRLLYWVDFHGARESSRNMSRVPFVELHRGKHSGKLGCGWGQ